MWQKVSWGLLLLLAVLFPWLSPNKYYLTVVTLSFIYAMAVQGLNIIVGYLGQLSLAQAGFFGLGAYTCALLVTRLGWSFWLALPAAALLVTAVALAVGLISFRTRGHYFVILTLCIGVIINLVIEKWEGLTGGVRGLIGIPVPDNLGPISFASMTAQYYLVLVCLLLVLGATHRIVSSLVGRTFLSIRNSEDLAAALGIDVLRHKLLAFGTAAFFAGVAGALYASFLRFIGPEISHPHLTFEFLVFLLVGGQASLMGPVLGTLATNVLMESMQFLQDYRMLVFGLLLMLIVKFFPMGAVGLYYTVKGKLQHRKVRWPWQFSARIAEGGSRQHVGDQGAN
ncbi:MAG TPA: branched-chain amino acid ABC transporter permease [Clostridia bacterium]|nr:branched-chain amino acid ABC transporter permease [Clostridia bacterium]